MLEKLTRETFAEHLNTTCRIHDESFALDAELIEANEIQSSPTQEQFSIIFRGPAEPPLTQGIHKIEHDQIGTLELFLVPVGEDDEGLYYEAYFNRLIEEDGNTPRQ